MACRIGRSSLTGGTSVRRSIWTRLCGFRSRVLRLARVAAERGVTPAQLKTWRLELEAAGSATAIARSPSISVS